MRIAAACGIGVLLDWIFGDPVWLYHPVRMIGGCITRLERALRRIAREDHEKLLYAGGILWIFVVMVSTGVPWLLLKLAESVHPLAEFLLECFWCYQLLAARCLMQESRKVYDKLSEQDLPGARRAVSMIVGRDTGELTAEGVAKAAVETVAENTSDGVIAPLFYLFIGGPIFGFFYKAVNTMDSMVGYRNETYQYFGRIAAKMDDGANYFPARISAVLMMAAAALLGLDAGNAYRIYKRDRRKHASPNAAQTEAVCAGALRVQLAGDACYFGKLYKKEYIGDPLQKICPEDILRANRLMLVTEILALAVFGGLRLIL